MHGGSGCDGLESAGSDAARRHKKVRESFHSGLQMRRWVDYLISYLGRLGNNRLVKVQQELQAGAFDADRQGQGIVQVIGVVIGIGLGLRRAAGE